MVKTILIGLDGSPYSDAATDLGLRWAMRGNVMLVGLGVINPATVCPPELIPLGGSFYKQQRDETLLARARTQVEQYLGKFALRCSQAGVAHKLLEDTGVPADQIVREAQRYDLILLGQQTQFHGADQDQPDDTLTTVLRNTPRPVVTVPEKLNDATAVVIAYDGSLQAARALYAFQTSGLADQREVHVVSVGSERVEAARHASRAVEFLGFHDISATQHTVSPTPSTAEAILNQVRDLNAGLLVMGCYGQPTYREFFLGSVTRTVLTTSKVPLFLDH